MDEQELLRQIAHVAGCINRHQAQHAPRPTPPTPYTRPQQQHGASVAGSRHKTLDLRARTTQTGDYIASRSRGGVTLTHAPRYAQVAEQTIATSRAARQANVAARLKLQEAREAAQLRRLEQTTLEHAGIVWQISKRANLLIRMTPEGEGPATPLETTIQGVVFLKSPKTNNLFRKTAVALRARRRNGTQNKRLARRCPHFTRRGYCTRDGCSGRHSPGEVAICRYWLRGSCTRDCKLSHTASAHNTPQCRRFAKGACSVDSCRFAHVEMTTDQQDESIQVCERMTKLGWCDQGAACPARHVLRKVARPAGAVQTIELDMQTDSEDDEEDGKSSGSEVLEEQDFDEEAFNQDFVHL